VCSVSYSYDEYDYDDYSPNPAPKPFFSVDILIDFKDDSVYLKTGEKNVLDHLSKLLKEEYLADVTFKVKNETLKAHRIIVASGSPVLSAMFQQDFVEKKTGIVEIEDTQPEVFRQLLQYLYTGQSDDMHKEEMALNLLVTADKYGVESLKEECALILIKNLKVENATQILLTAHLHSSSKLLQQTMSFISKNGKAICSKADWLKLMKHYPDLCFQATQLIFLES